MQGLASVTCARRHCQEHEVEEVVFAGLPQWHAQEAGTESLLTTPWQAHHGCDTRV